MAIKPELLRWARERARLDQRDLAAHFPNLPNWEDGLIQPTLRQIENFAKATRTPIGYLFLQDPPAEGLPLPDFRSGTNPQREHPSPELLDMIHVCQQRQEWYRDYARSVGEDLLSFVGSARLEDDIVSTAEGIRTTIGFDLEERSRPFTWTEALRDFIALSDGLGILVMCSGVVLNNNHRRLDAEEFRGFAIAENLAPLIFINGADTKAAQMFTLAHELAHIWLGQSALSDAQALIVPQVKVERWCNQVAAEILVPLAIVQAEYQNQNDLRSEMDRLARRFKVSTLVVLRRIYDAGGINKQQFWEAYEDELTRLRGIQRRSGGDFYLTQAARVSKRFARALVVSTLEGQTLYRDAFRMLGFSKLETFKELGRNLGVII